MAYATAAASMADSGLAGVRLFNAPADVKALILRTLLALGVSPADDLWSAKSVEGKEVAAHIFRALIMRGWRPRLSVNGISSHSLVVMGRGRAASAATVLYVSQVSGKKLSVGAAATAAEWREEGGDEAEYCSKFMPFALSL